MEPSVELQPDSTILVLGPNFTSSLLTGKEESRLPPIGYTPFKKQLDTAILELTTKRQDSLNMKEQLQTLVEHHILEQWLSSIFALQQDTIVQQTPLVRCIIKLQQLGALVVYLYPDTVCEEAIGSTSYTLEQSASWCNGTSSGVLHPFGVHTKPSSLLKREDSLPSELLKEIEKRVCLCIGFTSKQQETDEYFKQFMNLITTYSKNAPLSLFEDTSNSLQQHPTLNIQNIHLPQGISPIGCTSKEIASSIDFPPEEDNTLSLSLILSNKTGTSDVTKIASRCPGVNFILMSNIACNGLELHSLSLRITKSLVTQFWSHLLLSSTQLIDNGVLCVIFDHVGCIVWLTNCGLGNQYGCDTSSSLNYNTKSETFSKPINGQNVSPVGGKSKTNTKHIPRWFTTKQKVTNGSNSPGSLKNNNLFKEDGTLISNSILHRRLSLPSHPGLPPPQHIKTKQSTSLNVSSRQQLLINKYLFTRKHRGESDPAGNSTLLRQLLSEEPKHIPRPDTSKGSPSDLIQKWTVQRRKDLYVKENSDWSSSLQEVLNRKMSKWERLHFKRKQALFEKEIKEEITSPSPSSSSMSTSSSTESLRQQLLSYNTSNTLPLSVNTTHPLSINTTTNPLLNNVNPYLLQATGNSALSLATTPSLIYPTSFLPTTYPFVTTLPYVQTALPQAPPTPNLLLASTVSSVVTPPASLTTPLANLTTPTFTAPATVKQMNGTTSVQRVPNHNYSSSNMIAGTKRKHTISHTSSSSPPLTSNQNNGSYISSLLKQDFSSSETKKRKIVSSSITNSDGEDERSRSPQSPHDADLWQFLLDLLLMNTHSDCIQWNPYVTLEFEIKRPKEIAKLWNSYICNNNLKDYSKFKHAIEYCCSKVPPILYKVDNGKPYVYRFNHSVLYYISMRYNQLAQNGGNFVTKIGHSGQTNDFSTTSSNEKLNETRQISRSKEVLVVD